ncbi:rhamnogalacturonan acetylesterase [Gracilibacillus dipsosauri]|uniref:Lysophospholipase n=1 Tax=Gracilibacillus dipsosauri TaxID=178340 RepID=A0A317KWN4_9BACI|nr:rhamnogalacturonan acetylesterase [Gracilibacillus dipsosauri]PWU67892.1 lysophospholipase [Gracilibacillus dipsosauri]
MKKIQLFIAGDSTMADYEDSHYPQMGWGQVLPYFFTDEIKVQNHAASGRSTKSFLSENRWTEMERQFQSGDYVLIQFGHNDQKLDKERATDPFTTYQENLRIMIASARDHGVTPILLTSIARRHFDEKGFLKDTHGHYPDAVRQLALLEKVVCIDMLQKTSEAIERLGLNESKKWFMWLETNQFSSYPDGAKDDTHLREEGAMAHAGIFIQELIERSHPLSRYVKKIEVTE